jgi:non-ribosomal peptide synthase protein (TIGR01720 family)
LFPVILEIESCVDLGGKIKKVKEALRQIPNHGIGYGVLRYLRQHRDLKFRFEKFPQSEMSFNYLGQFDQLLPSGSPFTIAYGAFGSIRSPREKRRHLIEILGSVNRSQLTVAWFFSENIHRPSSIERVSEDFREALQAIIEHCTTAKNRDYTPSDFPAARIDQKTLDNLLAKINS